MSNIASTFPVDRGSSKFGSPKSTGLSAAYRELYNLEEDLAVGASKAAEKGTNRRLHIRKGDFILYFTFLFLIEI